MRELLKTKTKVEKMRTLYYNNAFELQKIAKDFSLIALFYE